mmetsp:Transcript_102208/g.256261  ORF Transcript_102208/g.256261 Transcript_102208/m.256261 type:complete len:279 (-) Transcript_102208:210-1046(-)
MAISSIGMPPPIEPTEVVALRWSWPRCLDRNNEVTALCFPNELSSSSRTDCVTIREFCKRCKHTISSASSCGSLDSASLTSASAAILSCSCWSRNLSIRAAFSWFTRSLDSSCARWIATARSEFLRRSCASCMRFWRRMSCEMRRCSSPAIFFSRSCTTWLCRRASCPDDRVAATLARFCLSASSRSCWIVLSASFFSKVRLRPSSIVAACRRTSSKSRQIFSSSRLKKRMRFSIAFAFDSTAFLARLASCTVMPRPVDMPVPEGAELGRAPCGDPPY